MRARSRSSMRGDGGAAAPAGGAQLVELRVDPVADEPALAHEGGGLVHQGARDLVGEVEGRVELLRLEAEEGGDALAEGLGRGGQGPERLPESDEIAGAGRAEGDPAEDAVEVLHLAERLAEAPAVEGTEGHLLDRVEPVLDPLELHEGTQDPLPQESAPHRGPRVVEDVEESAPSPSVGQALHELEVAAGQGVEDEDVLRPAGDEARHVREVALLGLAHVAEGSAGGGDGARRALAPEGLERRDAEVGEELPAGPVGLEGAVVDGGAGDRPLGLGGVGQPVRQVRLAAGQDLARAGGPDLVAKAVEAGGAVPLRDGELAGGGLQPRDAEARRAGLDGHQVGGLGRVEGGGLELRAGGDDPDDLALHDAPRRARVLHLLAEGHPEALADEAGDVGGGGVVGDPAHGDRVAVPVLRSGGERDLESLRGDHRVLEEHLVEVAHAEEEERVRVLRLHAVVLLHGGGLEGTGRRHEGSWSIS